MLVKIVKQMCEVGADVDSPGWPPYAGGGASSAPLPLRACESTCNPATQLLARMHGARRNTPAAPLRFVTRWRPFDRVGQSGRSARKSACPKLRCDWAVPARARLRAGQPRGHKGGGAALPAALQRSHARRRADAAPNPHSLLPLLHPAPAGLLALLLLLALAPPPARGRPARCPTSAALGQICTQGLKAPYATQSCQCLYACDRVDPRSGACLLNPTFCTFTRAAPCKLVAGSMPPQFACPAVACKPGTPPMCNAPKEKLC